MNKRIKNILLALIGVAIDAFGMGVFVLPYEFPVGGMTGFSRVVNHYSGLPISVMVGIFSAILFILGLALIGKEFAMTTIMASVAYPLFLGILENVDLTPFIIENRLLAGLFGGIIYGIGLGLVVRSGSSTGGTDLIGVIAKEKLGLPVAVVMYAVDLIALASQMLFSNIEDVLYGIFVIMVASFAMNKALIAGHSNLQFIIVSSKWKEINQEIQKHSDLGSTILHGMTGRFEDERNVIICTVHPKRVRLLNDIILNADPTAFATIMNVDEVRGRGFSMERKYKEK